MAGIAVTTTGRVVDINKIVSMVQNGELEKAISLVQTALLTEPKNPTLYEILGIASYQLGLKEQAAEAFMQQTQLNIQDAQAQNNLAQVLLELDQTEKAMKHAKLCLKIDSNLDGGYNVLGNIYRKLKRLPEALEKYQQALNLNSQNPFYLCNLGVVEYEMGQYQSAETHLAQAIELAPDFSEAYSNYASVLQKQNQFEKAIEAYCKALEINPLNADTLSNLGVLYIQLGEFEKGYALQRKAISVTPECISAYIGLVNSEILLQHYSAARQMIEKASALQPADSTLYMAKAALKEELGEIEEAISNYKKAIELSVDKFDAVTELAKLYVRAGLYDLAQEQYESLLHTRKCENLINWAILEEKRHNLDKMEKLLNQMNDAMQDCSELAVKMLKSKLQARKCNYSEALDILNSTDVKDNINNHLKSEFYFDKGSLLDKLKRYNEAFDEFVQANNYRKKSLGYELQDGGSYFESYKEIFLELDKKIISGTEKPGHVPIFIVGLPRSGTTLLEQILCSHPEISAGDELIYIPLLERFKAAEIIGSEKDYPNCLLDADESSFIRMREYYLSMAAKQGVIDDKAFYFTDKLPLNVVQLGLINRIFPDAPIIHIIRHPLDVCLSNYISSFEHVDFSTDLQLIAKTYNQVMELTDFYKEHSSMKYMEVRYEELVSEQEQYSRKVIDFLGLEWDASCLEFYKNKRVAKTMSYAQVTQKLYTSSRFRYKNYYERLKPVIPILQDTIERLGYNAEP